MINLSKRIWLVLGAALVLVSMVLTRSADFVLPDGTQLFGEVERNIITTLSGVVSAILLVLGVKKGGTSVDPDEKAKSVNSANDSGNK